MAKINLGEEDLKLLSECINEQKDVPAELLTNQTKKGLSQKLSVAKVFVEIFGGLPIMLAEDH